jgi:hypothetical protein
MVAVVPRKCIYCMPLGHDYNCGDSSDKSNGGARFCWFILLFVTKIVRILLINTDLFDTHRVPSCLLLAFSPYVLIG